MKLIDLDEQQLNDEFPQVLTTLLIDRTTGGNITWSCEDYTNICPDFTFDAEITVESITGADLGIIKPRSQKAKEDQLRRTKDQAEVFTPSWVCNVQNNLIDEVWFGRSNVFNTADGNTWTPTPAPIHFSDDNARTWQSYVDEPRLEITCGEAPYLVSRYDTVTGEPIGLQARIGLLDRKLRIVGEHCSSDDDWLRWSGRAIKATYGFELQGDSLLLARENILMTYQDYREAVLGAPADGDELESIATIISWNIWQMDGLTQCTPNPVNSEPAREPVQLDLFTPVPEPTLQPAPCMIMDWATQTPIPFSSLLKK